jgi:hypothetical protein
LTASLPVLFSIEAAISDDTPTLAEHLPGTLEILTITEDLWEYEGLQGRSEDVNFVAFFRQYLAAETPKTRLDTMMPCRFETTRGKVDLDKIEKGLA